MTEPAGRAALVTGANSGLGLATVLALAARGVPVVGTVRDAAKADKVAAAADEAGVTVATRILDVCDADGCAAVVADVRPFAVVNNAGTTCWTPVADVTDEEARHHLEVAVVAPMRLARLALPHMRAGRGGRIVQVSSVAGSVTFPLLGWYQGAKHAVEALSDALRLEVADSGVYVSVVAPGGFRSGVTDELRAAAARHRDGPYGTAFRRVELGFRCAQPLWSDTAAVAEVVAEAVTAPVPRPRYVVGRDARLSLFVDRVTSRFDAVPGLKDTVTRRMIGMPRSMRGSAGLDHLGNEVHHMGPPG